MNQEQLSKKTVADLRYIANILGIKRLTGIKKDVLIQQIIDAGKTEADANTAAKSDSGVETRENLSDSLDVVKKKDTEADDAGDSVRLEPSAAEKIDEKPVKKRGRKSKDKTLQEEGAPSVKRKDKLQKNLNSETGEIDRPEKSTDIKRGRKPKNQKVDEVRQKNIDTSKEEAVMTEKSDEKVDTESNLNEATGNGKPAETVEDNNNRKIKRTKNSKNKTKSVESPAAEVNQNGTESADSDKTADSSPENEPEPEKIIQGVLEVLADGYGFIRKENYVSSNNDVYVSPAQVRRCNLRTGDLICGTLKKGSQSDKYRPLGLVKTVNGQVFEEMGKRVMFERMTPIYPSERLHLEMGSRQLAPRIIDVFAPIGRGQRGLIVSPPKAGKTVLLRKIANSIAKNHPDIELLILLIDERPEEVTDMKRNTTGEVVSSTFDEVPEHHVKVAEMLLERAMRLVELGKDVVILLDSITRLARAYNLTIPPTGRSLSGGVDPGALHKPKKFFGAARNIEFGGSLTIIATALVDTGSRMDEVIYEEFKGTGNMELHLDRKLSEKRVFPAIDINKSGTRREEILLTEKELDVVWKVRRAMSNFGTAEVIDLVIKNMDATSNNNEFIELMDKRMELSNIK